MAFQQTVTFTALPNGIASDGRLKLSVFISPRLSSPASTLTLANFPDFQNFATSAQSMSFSVVFDQHPPVSAQIDPMVPQPDNYLWSTIFPPTCPVASFALDSIDTYGDRFIRSYPAANIAHFATNLYTTFGLSNPLDYPSAAALLSNSALGQFATDRAPKNDVGNGSMPSLLHQLDVALQQAGGVLPPKPYNPANIGLDMAQVYKFHEPPPIPGLLLDTPSPNSIFTRVWERWAAIRPCFASWGSSVTSTSRCRQASPCCITAPCRSCRTGRRLTRSSTARAYHH